MKVNLLFYNNPYSSSELENWEEKSLRAISIQTFRRYSVHIKVESQQTFISEVETIFNFKLWSNERRRILYRVQTFQKILLIKVKS